MTHEINIYGDIVPFKWFNDGSEFDIASLNDALSAITPAEGDELLINIHTFGGCTTTAFAIYNKLLNFKNKHSMPLTTRVDGYCASSGVILLLAGDKRIGNQYAEPFIHNAWTFTMGDKNEHQKQYENLARVDNQIATLYAERTNISKEEALQLMANSDYVSPENAFNFGFYTELENVYAAENSLVFNSLRSANQSQRQNNSINMTKEKETVWNKLKKDIDAFFGVSTPKNKILYTGDNKELDFYELADDATPAIGDKARFDGKPAGDSNNGEYVMASGETYKFSGEELTEIVPKSEDVPVDEETENLKTENENLKVEVENLKTEISNLKKSSETIQNKLSESEKIISDFKNFAKDEDDEKEDEPRYPKPAEPTKETRAASAFNKLKKQK